MAYVSILFAFGFSLPSRAAESNYVAYLDRVTWVMDRPVMYCPEEIAAGTNWYQPAVTVPFMWSSNCTYYGTASATGSFQVVFPTQIPGVRNPSNSASFIPANPMVLSPTMAVTFAFHTNGTGISPESFISAYMGQMWGLNYGIASNSIQASHASAGSLWPFESILTYAGREPQTIYTYDSGTFLGQLGISVSCGGRLFGNMGEANWFDVECRATAHYLLFDGAANTLYATNVSPTSGVQLVAGSAAALSAGVRCKLRTQSEANLELKAFDQGGDWIGVGRTQRVRFTDPEQTFAMSIPGTNDAPAFLIPSNATRVVLKARLEDPDTYAVLQETICAEYTVAQANRIRLEVGNGTVSNATFSFRPFNPTPAIWQGQVLPWDIYVARITYSITADTPLLMGMAIFHENAAGDILFQTLELLAPGSQLSRGTDRQIDFDIGKAVRTVPPGVDYLRLAAVLVASNGESTASQECFFPVNWLTASNWPSAAAPLAAGAALSAHPDISYALNADEGETQGLWRVRYDSAETKQEIRHNLHSGARESFRDDFELIVAPAAVSLIMHYALFPLSAYSPFYSVVHSSVVPTGASHVVTAAPGTMIATKKNTSPRSITAQVVSGDLGLAGSGVSSAGRRKSAQAGVTTQSQVHAITRYWAFSPAIPADGTFEADLALSYETNDLPDDPRCDEKRLRILVPDEASGSWLALPTLLDTSNHVATARIDSLAERYALGTVAPFAENCLVFPSLSGTNETLLAVNAGAIDDAMFLDAYLDGGGLLSTGSVAAAFVAHAGTNASVSALFNVSNAPMQSWVRLESAQNTSAGGSRLGSGARFDYLPATDERGAFWILPDVHADGTNLTDILVVNPAAQDNPVALELRSDAGTLLGRWNEILPTHGRLRSTLPLLFALTNSVPSAWLAVSSRYACVASQIQTGPSSLATLQGLPPIPDAGPPQTLISPFFRAGGGNRFCWINLVNATTSSINATVSCTWNSGSSVGSPVVTSVPPMGQVRGEISAANYKRNGPVV